LVDHSIRVLKHHPDKKAGNAPSVSNSLYLAGINQNTNDEAFFKCIQKAHEVLTNA
jgi:DnaJ family protein C protein 2